MAFRASSLLDLDQGSIPGFGLEPEAEDVDFRHRMAGGRGTLRTGQLSGESANIRTNNSIPSAGAAPGAFSREPPLLPLDLLDPASRLASTGLTGKPLPAAWGRWVRHCLARGVGGQILLSVLVRAGLDPVQHPALVQTLRGDAPPAGGATADGGGTVAGSGGLIPLGRGMGPMGIPRA